MSFSRAGAGAKRMKVIGGNCSNTSTLHNRIAARFIFSALEVRDWTELRLARESGIARSVVSAHLSGVRKIQPDHLSKYMAVLNHQERKALLIAWLRDYMSPELVEACLNKARDDLSAAVKAWTPPLSEESGRMLDWWALETERDPELKELFKLLSAKAGYRPKRTTAGPLKRKRRG
jgi:hypothetical protein